MGIYTAPAGVQVFLQPSPRHYQPWPLMPSDAPPDFSKIAGPLFLGYLLNWGLYGVLSVQVCEPEFSMVEPQLVRSPDHDFYHTSFPEDRLVIKCLVYGDYLLESLQTFLFAESSFHTFAAGFGNTEILDQVHTIWLSVSILTGLVAFITQAFYAYRIYILSSRRLYVTALVALLSTTQLTAAIISGIQLKNAGQFSKYLKPETLAVIGVWQGSSALCDVLIAGSMTFYLRSRRLSSGIPETKNLTTRIIRLIVGTGTLTATIAVLSVILNFLPGSPSYYQTAISALAKLYSNSMMVVFNSRKRMSSMTSDTTVMPEFPTVPLTSIGSVASSTAHTSRPTGVLVTREEASFTGNSFDPPDAKNAQDLRYWRNSPI